jgi:sortase (surface protein transpeptidase)
MQTRRATLAILSYRVTLSAILFNHLVAIRQGNRVCFNDISAGAMKVYVINDRIGIA